MPGIRPNLQQSGTVGIIQKSKGKYTAVMETCKITHSSQYRNIAVPTPPTHASLSTSLIPPTADLAAWAIIKEYVVVSHTN
jgi:hypothetical protein